MSELTPAEFTQRILDQAFKFWFTPEVIARQEAGTLPVPAPMFVAAQVIFGASPRPLVRLNEEVKGNARLKAGAPEMKAGQPVSADMLEYIESFELPEQDANFGHLTAFRHNNGNWAVTFDFQQNRATAADLVTRAGQFISAARHSFDQRFEAPYIDNLFSACELLAKARLIPSSEIALDSRTHGVIHSSINRQRKHGNVSGDFVDLFNDLTISRAAARYAQNGSIKVRAGDSALSIVEEELRVLQLRFRRELDV
ncbi:hypothetical protein [Mesorhizobium sp. M0243]|uniref:hypothetical protein n=1 Tax=Mesorhizobium sp. M0243 TaxID=2956925 RepID=UPI00333DBFE5